MTKQTEPLTPEQKLDLIVGYLHQMNRRDRARTIAGFFSGTLHLAWFLFIIGFTIYTIQNADLFLEKITAQAAKQAANMTSSGASNILNSFSSEQLKSFADRFGEIMPKQPE